MTIDDGANGGDNSRGSPSFMYYVNDGIYGSFNCIMFDHYTVVPSLLRVRHRITWRDKTWLVDSVQGWGWTYEVD